jgi:hypothetical protein
VVVVEIEVGRPAEEAAEVGVGKPEVEAAEVGVEMVVVAVERSVEGEAAVGS